jgi:aryl-phospho-beta-D-glucosidase BglC (GH1 family)
MKRLTILVVLILLLVACGPQSPVREEEEQPPALSEVKGAAQEPSTTEPVKADQPSPLPEATSTQPEAPPTEPGEASPEPGREIEGPASGESEASPGPAVVDKWTLWVDGPHLRGVDLHPCRLFTLDDCVQTITRQDIQDLRNQGANLINASYPGVFTEAAPYQVSPTALDYLDNLIGWAEEVGIYVVIHFRTGPGRNEGAIVLEGDPDFAVWSDQAAQDAWTEMWRLTAERYRGSPVVVGYDLMVEPHPNTLIDPDGELEPYELQDQVAGTLMDWNALAAEITAAIRQVDPDTPIIVNSLGWAAAAWFPALQPSGDPRTIYSLHAYDPDVYIMQDEGKTTYHYPDVVDDYGETITFDRAWLDENYPPVREFAGQHNVPIYVGEFGTLRWVPEAAAFLYDQTDLFEQYGWNYAVYVWRGDEPYFDGFNLEFGPDPENHASAPGNPLLGVFLGRWAQNVDFP